MSARLAPSRRLRRTPFSDGVEAAGVSAYTVYNRMLLPAAFESVEADYRHLKDHVQLWDVSAERQVELRGPGAVQLLKVLTPRDLSKLRLNRGLYIPVVDADGGMLNDPVLLQVDADAFWVSIADSDLLLWIKGLAIAHGFDLTVSEPDVSPLAVQGPKAEALMARVFGDAVCDLRFFGAGRFRFRDHDFVVTRSGYSKQGGFEIYVEGHARGMPLWEALMEAGADLEVRAGCPNLIERIEGGLLSYGNDMTTANSPLECGLDRYVDAGRLDHCIGGAALAAQRETGPARRIRPIAIEADSLPPCDRAWPLYVGAAHVGQITSAAISPDFGGGVAIGMVSRGHWDAGAEFEVETQAGRYRAVIRDGFWA
ncbi:dimethylsulfoniopropionate demethylase [Roseovarius spongiae]|uniref:dimethylsulfoniopropionate demethylase n=1 Tax=Roseovarius spongiae TaxID=2320272 RepID=UPI001408A3CE|nr:dimethylsulfoniopropionate demethylase [Roseovarius spongiae]